MEPLLDENQLSKLIGQSPSTLQKSRVAGGGPPYIKLGRLVRYRQSDVEAWLAAKPAFASTTAAEAR